VNYIDPPIIGYIYNASIARQIFNYKKSLSPENNNSTNTKNFQCDCNNSSFKDPHYNLTSESDRHFFFIIQRLTAEPSTCFYLEFEGQFMILLQLFNMCFSSSFSKSFCNFGNSLLEKKYSIPDKNELP
jgi:hypothetical protein